MNIRDITSLEEFKKWKPNIFKNHIATIVFNQPPINEVLQSNTNL